MQNEKVLYQPYFTRLTETEEKKKKLRSCKLVKWDDVRGFGLKFDKEADTFKVLNVESESPAEAVGILKGDLVVDVNDKSTSDMSEEELETELESAEITLLVVASADLSWYNSSDDDVKKMNTEERETPSSAFMDKQLKKSKKEKKSDKRSVPCNLVTVTVTDVGKKFVRLERFGVHENLIFKRVDEFDKKDLLLPLNLSDEKLRVKPDRTYYQKSMTIIF